MNNVDNQLKERIIGAIKNRIQDIELDDMVSMGEMFQNMAVCRALRDVIAVIEYESEQIEMERK